MKAIDDRRHVDVEMQDAEGDWHLAGTILLPEHGKPGGFLYDADYMAQGRPPVAPDLDYRAQGKFFAVDPADSPNLSGRHARDLHAVFAAHLPGPWGELVMTSHSRAYANASPAEKLWQLAGWRSGALRFASGGGSDLTVFIESSKALQALQSEVNTFIQRYASERSIPFPLGTERQRWALAVNGGTSPKAAYQDDDGTEYVAKFPREILGSYEEARVEAAMMEVSDRAGLPTARAVLATHPDGSSILLSERFDRRSNGSYMQSIAADVAMSVPRGARADYTEVATWLWDRSSAPEADVEALFGRMLLNVAVNNTDDHLGQLVMLRDGEAWRLAPNIDVLIDEVDDHGRRRDRHMTIAGDQNPMLTVGWIEMTAGQFGLSAEKGREIARNVLEAVETFPDIARAKGVPESTLRESLMPAIDSVGIHRVLSVIREDDLKRKATLKSLGMQ